MHINVLKPKICELIQKVTKYATTIFKSEIYILWIEFISNQNFNMYFLDKYENAWISEP
jgi:hypothetical protein